MFKHTVNFVDFNGNDHEETLYFNYSKPELMKMIRKDDGKYIDNLNNIADSDDAGAITEAFSSLVLDAYGKKSEDGTRFVKNDEIRTEFEQSIAYETFLFEMLENPELIDSFMKSVLPKDLVVTATA